MGHDRCIALGIGCGIVSVLAFSDVHGPASSHGPGQSHGPTTALAWPEILENQSCWLRLWLSSKLSGPLGGFDKQFYKFNLAPKPFLDMSEI